MLALLAVINTILLFFVIYLFARNSFTLLNDLVIGIASLLGSFYLISSFYYLSLWTGFNILVLNIILIAMCVSLILINYKKIVSRRSNLFDFKIGKTAVVIWIALLLLTRGYVKHTERWGEWDAWAIWNLHAKFLFYPENWTRLFTNKIAFTHPDYPLMLPGLIAFYWRSLGDALPLIPAILSYIVLLAIPLLLFSALQKQQSQINNIIALIALLLLCTDTRFITIASAQYADSLLSLIELLSFVLLSRVNLEDKKGAYLLGFSAGMAIWVKNEGTLFFLIFSFMFFIASLKDYRTILKYIAGTLFPLFILISFKLKFAPVNDLIEGNVDKNSHVLEAIKDFKRYFTIAKYSLSYMLFVYTRLTIVIVIALFFNSKVFKSIPMLIIIFVFLGYLAVYLVTPYDLKWHLNTSFDRVIHHLYPAALFVLLSSILNKFNFGDTSPMQQA